MSIIIASELFDCNIVVWLCARVVLQAHLLVKQIEYLYLIMKTGMRMKTLLYRTIKLIAFIELILDLTVVNLE
jgi:hypothetical protein